MAVSVGVYDAKTQFTKLLQTVEAGETVTITRHGKPVAQLTPIHVNAVGSAAEAVVRIREISQRVKPLEGVTIKEMIEEGRM